MWRKLASRLRLQGLHAHEGQALPLFALGLIGMVAIVGISVDVGRAVWARTQMQAAVDASGLAAAQSMPDVAAATTNANTYWNANNGFLVAQGHNVQFGVSFPNNGNRRLAIHAEADIDTWFTRVVGFDTWHITADSQAESQVLDIALVIDVSGSMCWGTAPPIDKTGSPDYGADYGPGHTADHVILQKKPSDPPGSPAIYPNGANSITMYVNDTSIFTSTSAATNNARFGIRNNSWTLIGTTKYWQFTPRLGRQGMIVANGEVFQITAVPSATTLTVTRAQPNTFTGVTVGKIQHSVGELVNSAHGDCYLGANSAASGPWQNYDDTVTNAQFFTTLFNANYDQIGLSKFSSQGSKVQDLTKTYSSVTSGLASMGGPTGGTNTAHGIAVGRMVLDGVNARVGANRVLVLETDGNANSYCTKPYSAGNYNSISSCPGSGGGYDGDATAVASALSEASRLAADNNTRIYVIGLGPLVNDAFLQNIADIGGGQYYKAPTTADLGAAFQAIAEQTHISLVK